MKRIKYSKYAAMMCLVATTFFASCGSTKVEEPPVEEPVEEVKEEEPVKEEPVVEKTDYTASNKKLLEEVEKARLNALKAGADVYWKKSKVFYGSNAEISRAMLREIENARTNAIDAGADTFFPEQLSASDKKKSGVEADFRANEKVDYSDRLSSLLLEYETLEKNARVQGKAVAEANRIILEEVENTREDAIAAGAEIYWKENTVAYNNEYISFPLTEDKKAAVVENYKNAPYIDRSAELKDLVERYKLLKRTADTKTLLNKAEVARTNAIDAGAEVYFEKLLASTDARKDLIQADFNNKPGNDYSKRLNAVISEYESMLGKVQDYIKDIPEHNAAMLASVEKAREKAVNAGAETCLKNAKVSYVPYGKTASEYISLAATDEKRDEEKTEIEINPNIDHTRSLKDLINRYETLEKASYTQAKLMKAEDARAEAIDAKAKLYVPELLAAADEHRDSFRADFDKDSKADYSERLNSLISEYKAVAAKANDLQERELLAAEGSYISFKGTDVKSELVQNAFEDFSADHTEELTDLIERYKVLEKASYTQAMIDNVEAAREKAINAGAEKYFASTIADFDAKKDSTKINFKNNPRANYSKTLNDLVDKYNSLSNGISAAEMKDKVEALDTKYIDADAKKAADAEFDKYAADAQDVEGKLLAVQADKARKAYAAVADNAFGQMVVDARKDIAEAKKLAESEKAQVNKFTKEAYKAATDLYRKADSEYRIRKNEAAYNDYKAAEKSYLDQYEAVKKAKAEAVKAQEASNKTKDEAESFAVAADATNPLTDKVAGIEDEDAKLLEEDTFVNPSEAVIELEAVEQIPQVEEVKAEVKEEVKAEAKNAAETIIDTVVEEVSNAFIDAK